MLLVSAFWQLDPFTAEIVKEPPSTTSGRSRSRRVPHHHAAHGRAWPRAVTLTGAVLAFPIAYYMAKVASPRTRNLLIVAILIPLWASYLVKVYSWRIILPGAALLNWLLAPFGIDGPGYSATSPPGSCSPTSGCRT